MDDNKIRNILSKDDDNTISVPAWSEINMTVRKNNFFSFGLRHFNIYTTAIVLLLAASVSLYLLNSNSNTLANENVVEGNKYETKFHAPKGNDELKNTAITVDTLGEKKIESEKPLQKDMRAAGHNEIKNTRHKENTIPVSNEISNIALDTVSTTLEVDSIAEQLVQPEKIETEDVPKGKTIFVFETDTVIEYDTLMVDKKKKKR